MNERLKAASTAIENSLAGRQKLTLRTFLLRYNAILILILLSIVAGTISPLFFTKTNIFTLLRQQSVYLIISMGMLMVIITAGIDLSAASTTAVSSVILASSLTRWNLGMAETSLGIWGTIGFALLAGLAIGAVNGFLVARLRMPAFIVTLAVNYAAEGVSYIITKGNTVMLNTSGLAYSQLVYPGFAAKTTPLLGIPYTVILAAVIVAIFYFVMKYTTFGRVVYAIGSNESAVQLAGINSKKYLFFVYLINGLLCGIAGVVLVCRSGNASALTSSGDYTMNTIAGVVIGGAALSGGEGSVLMTVIGVFIIAVIGNIMNLINLPSYPQMVVKAAVIVLAVLLKSVSSKKQG